MRIIAGLLKNHPIAAPKGAGTRPTSSKLREAVFNICQHSVEGSNFLDLFAGSGAMGLEALSRGAASAAFIEQNAEALRCINHNLEHLKLNTCSQVLRGDVWKMLEKLSKQNKPFQIIYADPPYNLSAQSQFWERLGEMITSSGLLEDRGMLFLEQAKGVPMPALESPHLFLVSSRKMGAATLLQFQKREKG